MQLDLYLRGSNLGLSWNSGTPLEYQGNGLYTTDLQFDTSNVNQTFEKKYFTIFSSIEMKAIIGQSGWMIGANAKFTLAVKSQVQHYVAKVYPWFQNYNGRYEILTY